MFSQTIPTWMLWAGWAGCGLLGLLIVAGFEGVKYVLRVLGRSASGSSHHGDVGLVFTLYFFATVCSILIAAFLGPVLLIFSFTLREVFHGRRPKL